MVNTLSPYLTFSRQEWCKYRLDTPLPLSPADLDNLHGTLEKVSLAEVEEIYLPLSRFLSFFVTAVQNLHGATTRFLGINEPKVPFIIGVSGSVAVGKSTTSRVLSALLAHWSNHPRVAILTTDGFLYPNARLKTKGLLERKGFPESYDVEHLLSVLQALKSGADTVSVPIYSHHSYDIVADETLLIERPDIVIVEGLNLLQTRQNQPLQKVKLFVSDFLDFSIFVDADLDVIKQWYIERVLSFCAGPFQQEGSYFHFLTKLNHEEVVKFAERVWREINELNLLENILPFKQRAQLILHKESDHSVQQVMLRKL